MYMLGAKTEFGQVVRIEFLVNLVGELKAIVQSICQYCY